MTTFFQFVVIGLGTGAVYALLAQGVVVIHRASGVVNFAQGGVAVSAGFVFYSLTSGQHWAWGAAFPVVMLGAAAFGAAVYWLAIRPLRSASQLTQVMMALAVLVTLLSIVALIYGYNTNFVTPFLPQTLYKLGGVTIQLSQCLLLAIAGVSTLFLWAGGRFTLPGLAVRGIAENRRAVSALGWSPDALAMSSWMGGCALGAAAGMLIAPVTGVQVDNMVLLIVATLAAALVGNFTSFPLALAGSLLIGIAQSLAIEYLGGITGASDALPFAVIVVLLVFRGRGLIARGHVGERMAELGAGVIRPRLMLPAVLVTGVLTESVFGSGIVAGLTSSLVFGIVLLSVVLLTGFAGQLSLAQMSLAGIGALVAGRCVEAHWPFLLASCAGVAVATVAGLVFAIPALRTRGMTLAIVTFGLGSAVTVAVFDNNSIVGGDSGTPIGGSQSLLGWNFNPSIHPQSYALVALVAFAVCAVVVANVRRGRVGRRLIAVRSNERAASALGINVYGIKLYAFGLSAALAAVGGILLAFQYSLITYDPFAPFQSLLAVAYTVLGGVGFVAGAIYGSFFAANGLGTWLGDLLIGNNAANWLALIGGLTLIAVLLQAPNGMIPTMTAQARRTVLVLRPRRRAASHADGVARSRPAELAEQAPVRVVEATLEIRNLTVRFGGVTAVNGLNMTLSPGQISGLIGPNGAGKTTVIDATTGLVRATEGEIVINGRDVTHEPMYKRARAGLGRSFQSLELFEGISVRENLLAACEPRDRLAFATDLVRPGNSRLASAAVAAVREFGLENDLDRKPAELPYGRRRLVAIARAIASQPSVLLLDEPGAGLDDQEVTEIATLVRRLASNWGIAVLLVEHDMNFVMAVCDEITVIDFGKQIAHGTPAEIRSDPGVIAAYLGAPHQPGEAEVMTPEQVTS